MRTSLSKFAYQMVFPYQSIFIVALGASATQLGVVNSAGMIVAAIVAPFTGWFIDRNGPKNIYLIGIGLLAISYLTYGLAQNWLITTVAMVAYWLGFSVSVHSCATICGNCLANQDRAKGMTFCETVASSLFGMAGPILAAWLVIWFGGVNVAGIRPLFFIALAITIGTLVYIFTRLSEQRWKTAASARPDFFRDMNQIMKEGRYLKRWLLIAAMGQLPLGMIFPFSQVFAHEMKGADGFVLGAMVTGSALLAILFGVPLGRLADRAGRKRALYIATPLFWASSLLLIWAPNSTFLIIAGAFQGFYWVAVPISAAMERELVPAEQMGRWIGISRFFRMLLNACLAVVAGVIWDKVGPQYVFLAFVGLDLVLRLPLLISMPETLKARFDTRAPVASA